MQVLIIEKSTEKVVAQYPTILSGANYDPSTKEYEDEGWRCAVEDGLVKEMDRSKYSIQVRTLDA